MEATNGIIEITNKHGSKHAEGLLNKVIPVFKIPEGETAQKMSTMLWWQVQIALDPSIKGFFGDIMGRSSTVKAGTLHNREVREILSYIVVNSRAEAWSWQVLRNALVILPIAGFGTSWSRNPLTIQTNPS